MAELDDGQQTGEGKGWMGRAFGKVMGIFSTSQTALKEGELNDEFLEPGGSVKGSEKKRRRDNEPLSSNSASGSANGRGRGPVEVMDEDSDDSDVDAPLVHRPTKKARGKHDTQDNDESVAVSHRNGGRGESGKVQRAAKKVGASASGAKGVNKASSTAEDAKRAKKSTPAVEEGLEDAPKNSRGKSTSKAAVSATSSAKASPSGKGVGASGSGRRKDEVVKRVNPPVDDASDAESSDELDVSVEEEEDIEIRWPPMPTKVENDVVFYSWVEIDGVRLSRGDSVYLRSGSKLPYVGKLVELRHDEKNGSTCQVAWWYRKGDLPSSSSQDTLSMDAKELVESSDLESNPIQSISITKRPTILFGNDNKTRHQASTHVDTFFYSRFLDATTGKVQSLL